MSVSDFFLCVLVFAGVSIVAGSLWFSFCRWDELLVSRNYKPLAVVIPLTFALTAAGNFWFSQKSIKTENPIPVPVVEKKEPKKATKPKRKPKPKKEENSDGDNSESGGGAEVIVPRPEGEDQ